MEPDYFSLTPFETCERVCGPGDSVMDSIMDGMCLAEDGGSGDPSMTVLMKMHESLFQTIKTETDGIRAVHGTPSGDYRLMIYQSRVELCDAMPDNEVLFFASRDLLSCGRSDYSRVVRMRILFQI